MSQQNGVNKNTKNTMTNGYDQNRLKIYWKIKKMITIVEAQGLGVRSDV